MTENLSLTYEFASQEDSKELNELYNEFYPHLGWTEDFLRWEYFENPAGPAKIWVVKSAGQIIATYVAIPHELNVHKKICLGWRIQDVLTKPEFRGLGIYHTLSKSATDYLTDPQFFLGFTFPKEKTTSHNGFVRSGWTNAFRVPLYFRPNLKSLNYEPVLTKVSPLLKFDFAVEQIWKSHVSRISFALHRSADFLNWRYLANPKGKYFLFHLSFGGDEAILVLKYYNREDGTRWAHACDYFQSGTNEKLTESAVKHWINFALALGCQAMSCWSPTASTFTRILKRCGFIPREDQCWWAVIKANADIKTQVELCDENRWHLSMGDSDVF
jgi:hypothetical protein